MIGTTSVADTILARYGFGWELNPYRIVDAKTNMVVHTGPHFDLTDRALTGLRNYVDRKAANLIKKAS